MGFGFGQMCVCVCECVCVCVSVVVGWCGGAIKIELKETKCDFIGLTNS